MIEWVLFDIGGVFLHTGDADLERVAAAHGLTGRDLEEALHGPVWDRYKRGQMDEARFWAEVAEALPGRFDGRIDALREAIDRAERLDEGVAALARGLAGRCRVAALSNAGADLERRLSRFGIDGLFVHVLNSHRVRMAKPDTEIYMHTADVLGAAPAHVLFVDDKPRNTEAAGRLGFATHVFTGAASLAQEVARHLS